MSTCLVKQREERLSRPQADKVSQWGEEGKTLWWSRVRESRFLTGDKVQMLALLNYLHLCARWHLSWKLTQTFAGINSTLCYIEARSSLYTEIPSSKAWLTCRGWESESCGMGEKGFIGQGQIHYIYQEQVWMQNCMHTQLKRHKSHKKFR